MTEQFSNVIPVLNAALICDVGVADPASGKRSLIGIFDRLWASEFPTQRPVTLYWKITDAQGRYRLKVRILQAEGDQVMGEGTGEAEITDRNASSEFLMDLPAVLFPAPGRYLFEIFMNDVRLGSAFMDAVTIEQKRGGL